jgi:sugar/nucleoside kinase (ribokinase family)
MNKVLWGVICVDRYTQTGIQRPGCGILHNAWHLQKLGDAPLLLSRIGPDTAALFHRFCHRHAITVLPELVAPHGPSASIDIAVQPSGEAVISNFNRGVWTDFRLTAGEESRLAQADNVHLVLAEGVLPEFVRVSRHGLLHRACVTADLLSFKNFTPASFDQLLPHLNVAFIGWKGDRFDPALRAIKQVAARHEALVVITLGERGIELVGRHASPRFFAVEPVPVIGNTNGCGDAFIAWFLHQYWRSGNPEQAIEHGKRGGAQATRWQFALPDEAYQTGD